MQRAVVFGSFVFFVALAGGTPCPALLASAQERPAAVFPARSEAVTVDVVVLDAQGQPVKGLTRADFVVREDGSPRSLVALVTLRGKKGEVRARRGYNVARAED